MLSHNPPSFSLMGDCIGDESSADLMALLERPAEAGGDEAEAAAVVERRMTMRKARRWEMKERRKVKEYPPPIPLLARTENLQSHMPWVLQRTYTSDGRLILSEEPVRHHEYFRASRRDGRLTLQLVLLDDEAHRDFQVAESEAEADQLDHRDDCSQCQEAEGESWEDKISSSQGDYPDESRDLMPAAVEKGGSGVGKFLNVYDITGGVNVGGGSSPCKFGVTVPALRPIHS